MLPTPRFRFSLRTLFVMVTVAGLISFAVPPMIAWLFPPERDLSILDRIPYTRFQSTPLAFGAVAAQGRRIVAVRGLAHPDPHAALACPSAFGRLWASLSGAVQVLPGTVGPTSLHRLPLRGTQPTPRPPGAQEESSLHRREIGGGERLRRTAEKIPDNSGGRFDHRKPSY